MSRAATTPDTGSELGTLFQYTVEAYKTFQKLAENLPNPMSAGVFKSLALDERRNRDLLETKYRATAMPQLQATLGGDLRFQDMMEGDLSYREIAEFLIARERTMERKLMEVAGTASEGDRNIFLYIAAAKRAHIVFLERELEFIQLYPDWFRREDAESVIVRGEER